MKSKRGLCHLIYCVVSIFLTCASPAAAQTQVPTQGDEPVAPQTQAQAEPLEIDSVTINSEALSVLVVPLTGEDLAELASLWQNHVKTSLEEAARLNVSLLEAAETERDSLRAALAEETETTSKILENYSIVLDAWQRKGASEEDLQPHRTYIAAFRVDAVRTIDARTLLVVAREWLLSRDGGIGVLLRFLGIALTIWAVMLVARLTRKLVQRNMEKVPNISNLLKRFMISSIYWVTFGLGILIALGLFGINVTPLFAVFGGLSFILGFALQETLGNLASGLMIMVLKPFDTGDYIEIAGASGFVDEMSVVSTRIRTFDNQIIVVPNSKIWGDVITNVSASAERRVDLVFGIGYSDSAAKAVTVLRDLVSQHPMCLMEPSPEIFVGELADSSVNIFCRPWCKSDNYWTVYWDLTGQAKERFDAEGISIPFPQRDVHLIPT